MQLLRRFGISATVILGSALFLSACDLGNATGYVPTKEEISSITVGKDTQETIRARFGSPAFQSSEGWIYVASYSAYRGPLPTAEQTRRVLAIAFDGAERVAEVKEFTLKDGQDIDYSNYVTETGGRKMTFLEQLRGSAGNFSAENFLNQYDQE